MSFLAEDTKYYYFDDIPLQAKALKVVSMLSVQVFHFLC